MSEADKMQRIEVDRMKNIEDDIKILKDKDCLWIYSENDILKAQEHILSEREQDKARIKELEEENLHWRGSYHLLSRKIDVIPRQKVKEILDKAEVMDYYTLPDVINDLQELLEEGE